MPSWFYTNISRRRNWNSTVQCAVGQVVFYCFSDCQGWTEQNKSLWYFFYWTYLLLFFFLEMFQILVIFLPQWWLLFHLPLALRKSRPFYLVSLLHWGLPTFLPWCSITTSRQLPREGKEWPRDQRPGVAAPSLLGHRALDTSSQAGVSDGPPAPTLWGTEYCGCAAADGAIAARKGGGPGGGLLGKRCGDREIQPVCWAYLDVRERERFRRGGAVSQEKD